MKKIFLILIVNSVLLLAFLVVGIVMIKHSTDQTILGERTSLFRPYVDVSGTSTARTSLTAGTSSPSIAGSYRQFIDTAAATFRGLVIRGVTSQSANLLELQDSAGAIVFSVDGSGVCTGCAGVSSTLTFGSFFGSSATATSTLSGHLAVLGNTRLGDAAGDLISIDGRLSTSFIPNVNGLLDLGTNALAFRNIYLGTGLFASGSFAIGTSGSSATSTVYHNLNVIGNLAIRGENTSVTSTITLTFPNSPGTSSPSLLEYRMPYNCVLEEAVGIATSTNGFAFRSILSVQASLSETTRNFNTIFNANMAPDLDVNQNVSSTGANSFVTTTLSKGQMLRGLLSQWDQKTGLQVQLLCRYNPF